MSEINYVNVGRTVECGNCHPEKFPDCKELEEKYKEWNWKCGCKCHDNPPLI